MSLEQLKAEVKQTMSIDEELVDSLLADASKRTTMRDAFQNKAVLSGFIGHKAFIPPADDGSGDWATFASTSCSSLTSGEPCKSASWARTGGSPRSSRCCIRLW